MLTKVTCGAAYHMKAASRKQKTFKWQVWAELLRLPNLFTVPGDILVGWTLAGLRGGFPVLPIVASLCLYAAGLLLNDVCDAKIDAKERPSRPIPSGRVKRSVVLGVAVVLALLGVLCSGSGLPIAVVLLGLIVFYDTLAKHIPWVGVMTMGCCRGMNLYLGAASSWPMGETPLSPFMLGAILFFTGYIVLVSVIAKHEADPKIKTVRHRLLAPVLTLLLVPFFVWFDRGLAWPPLVVAALMLGFVLREQRLPALVAGLIRFLIPLQLTWCLAMFQSHVLAIIALLLSCWAGAMVSARRFAGS